MHSLNKLCFGTNNTAQQDVDEASGSATASANEDSSDHEEEEDKVGLGKVALGMGEMWLGGMGGHMCRGLLRRTCEVLVWSATCLGRQLSRPPTVTASTPTKTHADCVGWGGGAGEGYVLVR